MKRIRREIASAAWWLPVAMGLGAVAMAVTFDLLGMPGRRRVVRSWEGLVDHAPYYLIVGIVITIAFRILFHESAKDSALACPRCARPYLGYANPRVCPRCHVALEPLAGFYDRHPEHRDGDPPA